MRGIEMSRHNHNKGRKEKGYKHKGNKRDYYDDEEECSVHHNILPIVEIMQTFMNRWAEDKKIEFGINYYSVKGVRIDDYSGFIVEMMKKSNLISIVIYFVTLISRPVVFFTENFRSHQSPFFKRVDTKNITNISLEECDCQDNAADFTIVFSAGKKEICRATLSKEIRASFVGGKIQKVSSSRAVY